MPSRRPANPRTPSKPAATSRPPDDSRAGPPQCGGGRPVVVSAGILGKTAKFVAIGRDFRKLPFAIPCKVPLEPIFSTQPKFPSRWRRCILYPRVNLGGGRWMRDRGPAGDSESSQAPSADVVHGRIRCGRGVDGLLEGPGRRPGFQSAGPSPALSAGVEPRPAPRGTVPRTGTNPTPRLYDRPDEDPHGTNPSTSPRHGPESPGDLSPGDQ